MPVRQQEGKVPSKKKEPPTSGLENSTQTTKPGDDATEEVQPRKKTWADVAMGKPKPLVASSTASTPTTSKTVSVKPAFEVQMRSGKNATRSGNKANEPGNTRAHRKVFTPSKHQGVADKPKLQTEGATKEPVSLSEARLENLKRFKESSDVMPLEQWTGAKLFPLAAVDLPLNQQQPQELEVSGDCLGLGYMRRESSSDDSSISLPGPLVTDQWYPDPISPAHVHAWDSPATSMSHEWKPWLSTFNGLPDVVTLNTVPEYPDFSPTFQNNYMDMTILHQSSMFQGSGGASPDLTSAANPAGQKAKAITGKPAIFVVPNRLINFASLHIQFSVQVINIPRTVPVTHVMLEAIAETPSGILIHGHIKAEGIKRSPEVFTGSFRATHEVGLYNLQVRLILPFKLHLKGNMIPSSDTGVIGDSVNILVSRNYYRESQHIPSISIKLQLEVNEKLPDGRPITNSKPWGLACDEETNRIYYSERGGHRVSCVDPMTGTILFRLRHTMAGGPLSRPCGVCCDKINRRVIVCDKDNHRISFFSMDGEYISSFGVHGYQNGMFSYPWDVDINPLGTRIVVADSRNKRVQLFDQSGNFLAKYSVFETNPFEYKTSFDYPRGITFNLDGQLIYVSDFNTQNIVELPIHFNSSRRLCPEGKLRRPQGIVVDQIGGILLADSRNNCLRHVSQEGKLLSSIRSVGIHPLVYPVNLTLLRSGYVAVLDATGKIHLF